MGKLFLHIIVSLDGRIEDAEGSIDWFPGDAEVERHMADMLASIDGMLFGRSAHALLAEYWPAAEHDPGATPVRREQAVLMNALPKYVLSHGGYRTSWNNSHVLDPDLPRAIASLKHRHAGDLALFAGAQAAQSLMRLGLIDEYRLMVAPVVLGGGKPLFVDGLPMQSLEAKQTKSFPSGPVLLSYTPRR